MGGWGPGGGGAGEGVKSLCSQGLNEGKVRLGRVDRSVGAVDSCITIRPMFCQKHMVCIPVQVSFIFLERSQGGTTV